MSSAMSLAAFSGIDKGTYLQASNRAVILTTLALLTCGPVHARGLSSQYKSVPKATAGDTSIVAVPDDDAELASSIKKAQANLSSFIKELRHPSPGDHRFAIMLKVSDAKKEHTDHIWLRNVTFDGTLFHGEVDRGDGPFAITTMKIGDTLSVNPKLISDWSYHRDGKLYGNYGIGILYRKSNEQDQWAICTVTGLTDQELRSR